MPELTLFSIILASISGLYYALWRVFGMTKKNEACITRIDDKLDMKNELDYVKEELTDMKDAIRLIKEK